MFDFPRHSVNNYLIICLDSQKVVEHRDQNKKTTLFICAFFCMVQIHGDHGAICWILCPTEILLR